MGQTYNSLGNTHNKTGNYPVALSVFQKSLTIKEKYGDKNGMANTFINIGNIYDGMSIFDKAEEYILKGSKLKEELGDKYGVAGALNNLCIIYNRTKKVDKAILTLESIRKDYIEYLDPYLKVGCTGKSCGGISECRTIKKGFHYGLGES